MRYMADYGLFGLIWVMQLIMGYIAYYWLYGLLWVIWLIMAYFGLCGLLWAIQLKQFCHYGLYDLCSLNSQYKKYLHTDM